jgi:hypothetical protein
MQHAIPACLLLPYHAVPCLSRATDIEKYDPKSEFALGGDEEGWVATHKDPDSATAGSAAAAAAAQEEDIPDLDAEDPPAVTAAAAGSAGQPGGAAAAAAAAAEDDDVPDISELELVEPDDEVSLGQLCCAVHAVGCTSPFVAQSTCMRALLSKMQQLMFPAMGIISSTLCAAV